MAENIVHLVLARLPDAPQGSKGISLFVVPKFNVNADGSLGERNGIYCGGLEHKMGIHGNATAQIVLDGAIGTLVGQPNKGLPAMFVMMNAARLGVGNQSLGLTEVAFQNALAYAKDRIQMRSLSGAEGQGQAGRPDHRAPRRAQDAADRQGLCRRRPRAGRSTHAADRQGAAPSRREGAQGLRRDGRAAHADREGLPHRQRPHRHHACMQVFGGHGFIKEWGMEQFVRDNRINMIYEGTNTIQSLDLLGRKVLGNNGATLKKFGKLVAQLVEEEGVNEKMAEFIKPIAYLGDQMTKFTTEIGFKGFQNPDEVGAAAVDYLRVAGHLVFGYFWARMAQVALRENRGGHRPVLPGQAADRALLLRQAVPGNGDVDAHRARRRRAADGDGRGAVLRRAGTSPTKHKQRRHDMPLILRHAAAGLALALACAVRLRPGDAGGPVEDRRRQHQDGEVADPHRRGGGVYTGRIEKVFGPMRRRTRCATSAPTTARASRRRHEIIRGMKARRRQGRVGRRRDPRPEQRQGLQRRADAGRRRQEARRARLHRLPCSAARRPGSASSKSLEASDEPNRPSARSPCSAPA